MQAEGALRKVVVVDSGAIIKGVALQALGTEFWTVEEVLNEVRDKKARHILETLPVQLQTRSVPEDALKAVLDFAAKTGDRRSLSAPDIKVIALTYAMHKEVLGIEGLRTEPITQAELTAASQPNKEAAEGGEAGVEEGAEAGDAPADDGQSQASSGAAAPQRPLRTALPGWYSGDDDEAGWITPENCAPIPTQQVEDEVEQRDTVSCITTDFAMQNVLMQIGLHVLSVDGLRVRSVKQWTLKCHACFSLCADMEKDFCPSCGNHSMMKVSVTVGSDGVVRYSRGIKNFNLRGTKYSLPLPKGGRHNTDPIMREDQLAKPQRKKRCDDLFENADVFALGMSRRNQKTASFGNGRKNPNENRRSRR